MDQYINDIYNITVGHSTYSLENSISKSNKFNLVKQNIEEHTAISKLPRNMSSIDCMPLHDHDRPKMIQSIAYLFNL